MLAEIWKDGIPSGVTLCLSLLLLPPLLEWRMHALQG